MAFQTLHNSPAEGVGSGSPCRACMMLVACVDEAPLRCDAPLCLTKCALPLLSLLLLVLLLCVCVCSHGHCLQK
jgi:hypothetical protein